MEGKVSAFKIIMQRALGISERCDSFSDFRFPQIRRLSFLDESETYKEMLLKSDLKPTALTGPWEATSVSHSIDCF